MSVVETVMKDGSVAGLSTSYSSSFRAKAATLGVTRGTQQLPSELSTLVLLPPATAACCSGSCLGYAKDGGSPFLGADEALQVAADDIGGVAAGAAFPVPGRDPRAPSTLFAADGASAAPAWPRLSGSLDAGPDVHA